MAKEVDLARAQPMVLLEIPGFLQDPSDPSLVVKHLGGSDSIDRLVREGDTGYDPVERVLKRRAPASALADTQSVDLRFRAADPNSGVRLRRLDRAGLVISLDSDSETQNVQVVGKVLPCRGSGVYGTGGALADVTYFRERAIRSGGRDFGELEVPELLERMTMAGAGTSGNETSETRAEEAVGMEEFWGGQTTLRRETRGPTDIYEGYRSKIGNAKPNAPSTPAQEADNGTDADCAPSVHQPPESVDRPAQE